ncbi:FMN-dependent NADH-azoreductase [Campylobacter mucosalis]|uniref:FMN-dependent NADH-azoreductase n=1 Tax=Campylobacter mucosalis TaxID=202 RepID=UPI001470712C|nr:NAD(P)H-dependent oxidoreductase [Campylobacter mucosalis]
MKTLIINSHPFMSQNSFSKMLLDEFCAKFLENFSQNELEILTLKDEFIPRLDSDMLGVFTKSKNLNEREIKIKNQMDKLMQQFLASKRIVIIMPMLNFNITSHFKDYMDNILIPQKTFKYVTGGSVPLLTDGRKVLLLQSSGAIYTANDRYTPLEFSQNYIKEMFVNMMGFDSFKVIRAQGTAVSSVDKNELIKLAKDEIDAYFSDFYV